MILHEGRRRTHSVLRTPFSSSTRCLRANGLRILCGHHTRGLYSSRVLSWLLKMGVNILRCHQAVYGTVHYQLPNHLLPQPGGCTLSREYVVAWASTGGLQLDGETGGMHSVLSLVPGPSVRMSL